MNTLPITNNDLVDLCRIYGLDPRDIRVSEFRIEGPEVSISVSHQGLGQSNGYSTYQQFHDPRLLAVEHAIRNLFEDPDCCV